jgi:hypothetical protein
VHLWKGRCGGSGSLLDDLIARLLPCGCVTSVEAVGEAAVVNVCGLAGLRCEAPTHSSVTSVEAGGEAAF